MATLFGFLRATHAGATAFAAAITLMTLGAGALIVDHSWLVSQRDLLKSAADAGAVAATKELQELPQSMSDADVDAHLRPVAERYVRLNLAENLGEAARQKMSETLAVSLDIDRDRGSVGVDARADLGGTLLSKWVLNHSGPERVRVDSGAEASLGATEIVLVIDVTSSMLDNLQGTRVASGDPSSRLNIVKQAATDLVDILDSHPNTAIAAGIVPWSYRIRLNGSTRTRWENDGWAVYPAQRTYPHPTRTPPDSSRYMLEIQPMPPKDRLPQACRAWAGCPDPRLEGGAPSFSTALPSDEPFVMGYFTDRTTYPDDQYVSYQCQDYTRPESSDQGGEEPLCYDLSRARGNVCGQGGVQPDGPWRVQPQDNCRNSSEVMPLTSDLAAVRTAVDNL